MIQATEKAPGENENATFTSEPFHKLYARIAEMYSEGGYGIEKDLQTSGEMYTYAAEQAVTDMKGKLANKYFALAEEVWAQLE